MAYMPSAMQNTPVPLNHSQQPPSGWRGLLQNQDLAMALLANSGYSPQKRSLGEILGTSMMQAQGMKSQREDDAFKRQYMQAQMKQMQNNQSRSPYGAIPVDKATAESLKKFEQTGKYSDLVFLPEQKQMMDTAEMRNYTFREQLKTPEEKAMFDNMIRNQYAIKEIGGVNTQVRYGQSPGITPLTTLDTEAAAAAKIAQDVAAGKETGTAQGALAGKAPAKASFDISIGNLRKSIGKAMQGAVAGPAGTVFDYGDKKLFNSRVQQLSTDLRTVYRIPGEGTLSDQEQQQYGLQLPSTDNPPEVNEAILADLEARTKARLETPISAPTAPKTQAAMPRIGEIRGGYRFKGGDPAKQENWVKQ